MWSARKGCFALSLSKAASHDGGPRWCVFLLTERGGTAASRCRRVPRPTARHPATPWRVAKSGCQRCEDRVVVVAREKREKGQAEKDLRGASGSSAHAGGLCKGGHRPWMQAETLQQRRSRTARVVCVPGRHCLGSIAGVCRHGKLFDVCVGARLAFLLSLLTQPPLILSPAILSCLHSVAGISAAFH